MKRNLLVCLCLMFFFVEVHAEVSTWDGISSSNRWLLKRDTVNQVCHITSAEELAGLSKLYQALNSLQLPLDGYTIFLDYDIDLANHEWTPIGVLGNYYSPNYGFTFEGNGHTISNMLITSCSSQYIKSLGLFGYCANQNFSVKDLTVNGTIRYPSESLGAWDEINVGGIIGYGNINSIVNCHSNANIYISDGSNHNRVGGIAGNLFTVGEKGVYKCTSKSVISVNGSKSCNLWVGGICGYNGGEKSRISCCSSNSNLTTYSGKGVIVGGISGDIGNGMSMDNCLFTGNITIYDASHGFIGGIVGMSDGDEIKNCIATGTISKKSGVAYMSGIVQANNANCAVSDCYYSINNVNTNGVGTYILDSELKNGIVLPNYDTNIWDFTSGENVRVAVKENVNSIMLNESSNVYYIGENRTLEHYVYPIDAYNKTLTWGIDDSSIATIDSNTGEIIANKEGVATITAMSNDDNSIKASVTIIFKLHNPKTHLMTNNLASEPTCDKEGNSEYYFCEKCNRYYSDQDATEVVELNSWVIPATGLHIPMNPKKENEIEATCTKDGSFDEVVDCEICGKEISRNIIIIPQTGHAAGDPTITQTKTPTCTEEGNLCEIIKCMACSEIISETNTVVPSLGHSSEPVVQENYFAPTCTVPGGYEDVEYCSVCNLELSRTPVEVPSLGHVEGAICRENEIEPNCAESGSFDNVIYCSVCNVELERSQIVVSATNNHKEGLHAIENEKDPTCEIDGSYEEVVYCSVCNGEMNRITTTIPASHTEAVAVIENVIDATCTSGGSYNNVIYCSVCNKELSKETIIVPATGIHIASNIVKENEVDATCATDGSYDDVEYCSVCETEISRVSYVVPATGNHVVTGVAKENKVEETCGVDGSYDDVEYCSVCKTEISRVSHIVPATGNHKPSEIIIENIKEPTDTESGYYDSVIYCLDCNKELSRETTEIAQSSLDSIMTDSKIKGIYFVSGLYVQSPSKGVYIVRFVDGSVKKMYINKYRK